MSVGTSGRIVIEVDVELKRMLYACLEKEHITLKQWFVRSASTYLRNVEQPSLFAPACLDSEKVVA
ncbi:MAG: hypothetical protein J5X21_12475 [Candidatus Accumulibacter sp.]|nr:hypothetical protein [Candidatus Accumulibacter conexus]